MSQIITAMVGDGVLKPEGPLQWPAGTRVRLVIEDLDHLPEDKAQAWEEFEALCEEISVDSGGERLTRDQLHERH